MRQAAARKNEKEKKKKKRGIPSRLQNSQKPRAAAHRIKSELPAANRSPLPSLPFSFSLSSSLALSLSLSFSFADLACFFSYYFMGQQTCVSNDIHTRVRTGYSYLAPFLSVFFFSFSFWAHFTLVVSTLGPLIKVKMLPLPHLMENKTYQNFSQIENIVLANFYFKIKLS